MKSQLMIFVLIALAIIVAFAFGDSIALAPRVIKQGLSDLTVNISINNVINSSVNGSILYQVNYAITYQNIGNVASSNVSVSSWSSMHCNNGPGSGGGGGFLMGSLNPNQAVTYQFYHIVNCQGNWSAFAEIDSSNVLTELNESNNNATTSISI